jgi:hypothetical protein
LSEDLLRHAHEFDRYITEPDMTAKLKDVLKCQGKKNSEGTKRAWAFPAYPNFEKIGRNTPTALGIGPMSANGNTRTVHCSLEA